MIERGVRRPKISEKALDRPLYGDLPNILAASNRANKRTAPA
jgi:hypothetical protein